MGVVKLGDVARESRLKWTKSKQDVPIVGLEHLIPDEIRFDAYDINTDNTFLKRFVKGQVLFGRRRAYQRKAAVAEFDGICSGDITVIEAIEGKMMPELLPFIIQTPVFFDYANRGSAGSLSPRVKWEYLAEYEVELPPLEEQKVLADKLWAAYRLKEAYKKLLVATDEMVKSQFIEMFGNPTNETVGKLGNELFSFASGKANIKSNLDPSFQYNCYGGNGITGKSKEYLLKDKTIVIGRVGEYCGCVHQTSDYCWVTDNAIYLKTYSDIYRFKFIYYMFVMMDFHRYASETGQPKITQAPLLSCTYPIPTLEAQDIFISIAEQADKSKLELKQCIENIDKVIKSLING